jgi:hypothetical protein
MEGIEWTKVKYIHSRGRLRNPFEHHLNINKESLHCKIGTGCGGHWWEGERGGKEIKVRVYGRWASCIHMKQNTEISRNCFK